MEFGTLGPRRQRLKAEPLFALPTCFSVVWRWPPEQGRGLCARGPVYYLGRRVRTKVGADLFAE